MAEAIIFDCFGVLFTDGWRPFVEDHFAGDSSKRTQATDLMATFNRGLIEYSEFVRGVAALAGIEEALARHQIRQNAPNNKLFEYIASELKPKYRIGLLSNTGRDVLGKLFTTEQLALFDGLSLSFETGFIKPQPEAYQAAAAKLAVATSECVFVDDQERHCIGARTAGMLAICYQDFSSMKSELEKLLADTNGQ